MHDGGTFSRSSFEGVGPVAAGTLGVLLGLVVCCSTLCFAGATFLKCAVDDLVGEPADMVEGGALVGMEGVTQGGYGGGGDDEGEEGGEGRREELEIPLLQSNQTGEAELGGASQKGDDNSIADAENKADNTDSAPRRTGPSSAAASPTTPKSEA